MEQLDRPMASNPKESHVCGAAGYGAIGDICPACEADRAASPLPAEPPPTTIEHKYRRELWLNHGHFASLYGDDGEMQCASCAKFGITDYKRSPLAEVEATVFEARLAHAATALAKSHAATPSAAEPQKDEQLTTLKRDVMLELSFIHDTATHEYVARRVAALFNEALTPKS